MKKKYSIEEAREKRREKIKQSMTLLEEGVVSLLESDRWEQYLKVQAKFHGYSFSNTMLILLQKPDATRVAGYNAWKKVGRQVRSGEKGIAILVPFVSKKKVENDAPVIMLDDGNEPSDVEEIEASTIRFGVGYVFDVSQTDGQQLPEVCNLLIGGDELSLGEYVDQIITARGYEVSVVKRLFLGGANGLCDYKGKQISLADDLSPLHRLKTRVHELAHSIMHSEEEYRAHSDKSIVELEAESVAFVVLSHFGLDSSDYSFGYLASWQDGEKEKVVEALRASGKRIQNAADEIIVQIETLMGDASKGMQMVELPVAALRVS